MSNVMWFLPTANEKDYNLISIGYLIQGEWPKYDFSVHDGYLQISNFKGVIMEFWFMKCPLLKNSEDIVLINDENDDCLKDAKALVDQHFDKTKEYLSSNYQFDHSNLKLNKKINHFIHKHFKCYQVDEGIHPEFLEPDYKFKNYG